VPELALALPPVQAARIPPSSRRVMRETVRVRGLFIGKSKQGAWTNIEVPGIIIYTKMLYWVRNYLLLPPNIGWLYTSTTFRWRGHVDFLMG
jgi:hypothetical protein